MARSPENYGGRDSRVSSSDESFLTSVAEVDGWSVWIGSEAFHAAEVGLHGIVTPSFTAELLLPLIIVTWSGLVTIDEGKSKERRG